MFTLINCILFEHSPAAVAAALLVCAFGCGITIKLFYRVHNTHGRQSFGWFVLTALVTGTTVWCTHFISMMGYDAQVPIGLDPTMTGLSLAVVVLGCPFAVAIATSRFNRFTPLIGGAVLGLVIAAMHYVGMLAYRVQGVVSWNTSYLFASLFSAVFFAALALHCAAYAKVMKYAFVCAAGALFTAVVSLHFLGMTAFQVEPLLVNVSETNHAALNMLSVAVTLLALMILGGGLASYFIGSTAEEIANAEYWRLSMYDELTGLANRNHLGDILAHEIDRAHNAKNKFALILIDMANIKAVNDQYGYAFGDQVLQITAKRLKSVERPRYWTARTGGNEFAIACVYHTDQELFDLLLNIDKRISQPIQQHMPQGNIGVSVLSETTPNATELLRQAELALYQAKQNAKFDRKLNINFYRRSVDCEVRKHRQIKNDLQHAIKNSELELHYQVQQSMCNNEIVGYEALLRWNHPEHGYIPPNVFIPLAEENGLVVALGSWVLHTACQAAQTQLNGAKIAVNISPAQFNGPDLLTTIADALSHSGLSPNRLEIELTETAVFTDKDKSLITLNDIKTMGVSVALDDFGTGYSSFDTLASFPFDKIKLDRSFIGKITTDERAKAITRAIITMGQSLRVPVLAEGVETTEQLALLQKEGCCMAQGYLLGRPMPIASLKNAGLVPLRATA